MAQRAERNDWTDRDSIRERAKASARSFLSPMKKSSEEERPLSPGLVARVTEGSVENKSASDTDGLEEDANEQRLTRPLEARRINEAPNSTYPG